MLVALFATAFAGQAWGETYQKITSEDDLEYGSKYIIVCESQAKAMGAVNTYGAAVDVTINNNTITPSSSVVTLTLKGSKTGGWILEVDSSNNLAWESKNTLNMNGKGTGNTWTISFTEGNASIANKADATRKIVYNASSPRFACYTSAQTAVQLYKEVVSSTETCAAPTFSPAAGIYTSAQNVTLSTTTDRATIYYTTDGTDPTTNSSVYSSAIAVSSTTTIKAMAVKDGLDNSSVASATYTIVNLAHAGTEQDPYSVADARTAIDANVGKTGVYATGIVSEIVTAYSTEHGNITFDIIDEGGSNTLRAYRCGGTDASDVAVGDIVVISGDLTLYNSIYEFNSGCTLVSLTHPVITTPTIIATPTSLNGFTYETGNGPSDAQSFTVTGANLTEDITLSLGANSDFEISTSSDANYGSSLNLASSASDVTVYVRLKSDLAVGNYNGTITLSSAAAENVEISLAGSVTAPEAPNVTWDLSTNSYDATPTADLITWSSSYATMTNAKGNSTTNVNNYIPPTRTSTRMYNGNTLTITPVVGYAITSVVFTATTDGYATALKNSTWTNATASAEGSTVTVTPTEGRQAISATLGGTCGFTSVKVYYVEDNTTYYNINVDNQVENGTISANLNKAEAGATVTLTATPDTYYELSGWTVLDGNAEEVTVTVSQENANVATFTMPSSDVEVSATFATTLTSYNITVDSDIENGTVEADMATAFEGATVTLTVTPATGFGLKTILAMTDGGDDVVLTKSNSTTYTFEMPADNVTVMAEFEAVHDITYTLASSITSGKHYVIANGTSGDVSVMGMQNPNNRAAVEGSVDETTLSVSSNAGAVEFVIYGPDANNHYTIYDGTGYLYAAGGTSSNHLKTYTSLDEKGQWSINFDGESNAASIVANFDGRNTMRYNSNNSIFSCYANGQTDVYLYEKDGEATPTESKTLNSYGYATYASQNALDFTNATDVTAWTITGINGNEITFSQIEGSAPAGTGLFLKGEASGSVTMTSSTGATALTGNLLEGITTATDVTAGEYFGLKGNEFVPVNAGTVPAGKALLPASKVEATGNTKALTFVFNSADGIKTVETVNVAEAEEIFNLAGQRLQKAQRGLNIIGGRKVVIK